MEPQLKKKKRKKEKKKKKVGYTNKRREGFGVLGSRFIHFVFRLPFRVLLVVGGGGRMWYLCVFYHRLLDYRKPEFESLADLFGAFDDTNPEATNKSLEWRLPLHHHPDSPFHYVNLPSEDIARNIANRSQYPPPFSLSLYIYIYIYIIFVHLHLY